MVSYFKEKAPSYNQDSEKWPWSLLRDREAKSVRSLLGDVRGKAVIELGCGAGFYALQLARDSACRVVAMDIEFDMVKEITDTRIHRLVADAMNLPLNDRFAKIICAGILEFVSDPERVLRGARRIAAPDVTLVVLVPWLNLWGRLYRRFHKGHGIQVRLYTTTEFKAMAKRTGWRVKRHHKVLPFSLIFSMVPD